MDNFSMSRTPMLDGIRKEAVFPRSLSALKGRTSNVLKRLFRRKGAFDPNVGSFVTRTAKKNLPLRRHMDLLGLDDTIASINKRMATGALPQWKLPKGVKAYHVTRSPGIKKLKPLAQKRSGWLDDITGSTTDMTGLGDRPQAFFSLGRPTGIFGGKGTQTLRFPRRRLFGRTIYMDPWDARTDLGYYINAVKKGRARPVSEGIDWDRLGLSMIFTGRPLRIKPGNIV